VKILILIGAIVAVGFLILTLVAVRPRKGQQHVIYKLEGPAGHWAVVTTDGKDHDTGSLPWTLSFWIPRGKSVELAAEFQDWFGSLWHGKKLAHTLVFLSIGSSLACFFIAYVLSRPPPPDDPAAGADL